MHGSLQRRVLPGGRFGSVLQELPLTSEVTGRASCLAMVLLAAGIMTITCAAAQAETLASPPGYEPVDCPAGALVVAVFGQSNSSNFVQPKSDKPVPVNLVQYDWKSDTCYRYREPLLGADNVHGNAFTPAALALAARSSRPVVVASFGVAGTSVLTWAYGFLAHQHALVLDRLKERNLAPNVFFWHQGEADGGDPAIAADALTVVPHFVTPQASDFDYGLDRHTYQAALSVVLDRTLSAFPHTLFGIALVSNCGGEPLRPALRDAQRALADARWQVFISADSDRISGSENRYDGCHFSQEGARRLSEEYLRNLSRFPLLQ